MVTTSQNDLHSHTNANEDGKRFSVNKIMQINRFVFGVGVICCLMHNRSRSRGHCFLFGES